MADNDYTLQINTTIAGDLVNIRGGSGADLKETLIGFAEDAEEIFEALTVVKQAGTAKGVFSGTTTAQAPQGQTSGANPTPAATTPSGVPTCKHGEMKFAEGTNQSSGKPYKGYYCTAKYTGKGSKCPSISLI